MKAQSVAAACLLTASLAAAPTAGASRKPTPAETKAIRNVSAAIIADPALTEAKNRRIGSILVSTLDPRYARVELTSKSAGPAVLLLHHSHRAWWTQQLGSWLSCTAAPRSVLADLRIPCTPPDGVAWIPNCGSLQSQPSSILLACADGNYRLTGLSWRRWGSSITTTSGTALVNDCSPDCARGTFHSYRIKAAADHLAVCGRTRYYSQLTVVYSNSPPPGFPTRDVRPLEC